MLSCTSERNPCCGPKIAASVAFGCAAMRSTMWRSSWSTEAGLQTTPTRLPSSWVEVRRRSDPSCTITTPIIPHADVGYIQGQTLDMRDWRVLVCIVVLIAASVVIAACGSSSSSTPSAPTTCPAPVVPQDQLNRTADAGGGSLTIPVTANAGCTWTATSNASFITITSGASSSGNGSVTATVAANTGAQRTGTLTVAGATVTVTQASSAPCTFTLSTTSLPMREGGGTAAVAVTTAAGCTWTAVSNSTFITVTSGGSGTGNGSVAISVAANTGAFRTGTLTIAGQTVTVSQDAAGICVTSISPTSQTFEAAGGTGTVTVAAPVTCGWQVSSNSDFITLAPGTRGNGDGSFSYTVAAN